MKEKALRKTDRGQIYASYVKDNASLLKFSNITKDLGVRQF